MTFGAHTVASPLLARCPAELPGGRDRDVGVTSARALGEPANLFAYPVGSRTSFDDTTRACLREAGITHAFSLYGGHQGTAAIDPLDVPRVRSVRRSRRRASVRSAAAGGLRRSGARRRSGRPPPPSAPAPGGCGAGSARGGCAGRVGLGRGGSPRHGLVLAAFATSKALSFVSIIVLAHLLVPRRVRGRGRGRRYIALTELGSDLGMKPADRLRAGAGISERIQTAFTLNLVMASA